MKKLFRLIMFVLLVGGWTVSASSLYVVRTADKKFIVIPKNRLSFHDTYADARNWNAQSLTQHVDLVSRLKELGKTDVIASALDPARNMPDAPAAVTAQAEQPSVATQPVTPGTVKVEDEPKHEKSIFDF